MLLNSLKLTPDIVDSFQGLCWWTLLLLHVVLEFEFKKCQLHFFFF